MHRAAKAYLETKFTTTSQGQVLLMLYDGAITFLEQAKERIDAKDYAKKGILISKALDIVNELSSSLNLEKGGDLAANLAQLYLYCNKQLFMANLKMNTALIDEVINILSGIRSAYAQIMDNPEAMAAAASTASAQTTVHAPARAPVAQQAPAGPAVTSAARVQGAYAQQHKAAAGMGVATQPAQSGQSAQSTAAPARPLAAPAASPVPLAAPAASVTPVEKRPAPPLPQAVSEAAAPTPKSLPVMPDLDDVVAAPPSLVAGGKRLANSSLYRKFAP